MKSKNIPSFKVAITLCGLTLLSGPALLAQNGTNAPAPGTNQVEEAVILTPKAPATPRINGTKVFGVRPGHPFMFTIPATGDRPMTFSAEGLPDGLTVDAANGHISGSLTKEGTYMVTLGAKNALGSANRGFKIVCGPTIGLTPALGWNSWNVWGSSVTQEKVKAAADAMVATGLINHGWTYINIDDYWEKSARNRTDSTLGGVGRDENGKIVPNPRFPDMKGLADYVHGLGLKIGIYSSPGPTTCGGCLASWAHEDQDAASYADWGFDYLKYDWCSYDSVISTNITHVNGGYVMEARMANGAIATTTVVGNKITRTISEPVPVSTDGAGTNAVAGRGRRGGGGGRWYLTNLPVLQEPYQAMRQALDKQPRDIMFSLCQYGMGDVWKWGAEPAIGGNSWRTTGDITDTWRSLSSIGFSQFGHEKFAGPGHFNDPDMMIVGKVNVGGGRQLHKTNLTPNEQYVHVSLWCLLTGPLLIGCDMTDMDEFTVSLLSNDEVLAVSQDPLGHQAGRVIKDGNLEVWAKDMEDGSKAVGLFNRNEEETMVTAKWTDLGISGEQTVRDLWRQKDIGKFTEDFHTLVPRHGVVLVKISK